MEIAMYSVMLEMALKQRRIIRQQMAEAHRNRHMKLHARLEKEHAKLSDKILSYQQKLVA